MDDPVQGQIRSRRASLQRVHIDDLPAEVLGKVVSHLEDKERCGLVPLVSKYWLHVHRSYPPKRKEWIISDDMSVTLPMVRWFVSIGGTLEILSVDTEDPEKPCYTAQMLALASSSAPNLRDLRIECLGASLPTMYSLALLSQIRELSLGSMAFPANGDVSGIACISALHSLEVIRFQRVVLCTATNRIDQINHKQTTNQADELWKALSHLKQLTRLFLSEHEYSDDEDQYDEEYRGGSGTPFFFDVSLVTQLRSLALTVCRECLIDRLHYPDAFGKLTQLTAFKSMYELPASAAVPLLGLPQLERLALEIDECQLLEGEFCVQSKHLTCLDISAGGWLPVEAVLPTSTPALSILRVLKLVNCGLVDFPASVACGLRQLRELNLRCNSLESVPSALQHITTLRKLDLSRNEALQLDWDDYTILEALSDVRRINLTKSGEFEDDWSAGSELVICYFRVRHKSCEVTIGNFIIPLPRPEHLQVDPEGRVLGGRFFDY